MTFIAVCLDCEWTYEHAQQEPVAEQLERHAEQERHDVELTQRAFEAPI